MVYFQQKKNYNILVSALKWNYFTILIWAAKKETYTIDISPHVTIPWELYPKLGKLVLIKGLFSLHTLLSHRGIRCLSLELHQAFTLLGRHYALHSLPLNSRFLPRSLSFCRRSRGGSFCRPTLPPWCWLTVLPLFAGCKPCCLSSRGLLP